MMNALWMVVTTGESHWVNELETTEIDYQNVLTSSQMSEHMALLKLNSTFDEHAQRQLLLLQNERLEYPAQLKQREEMSEIWNGLHYKISTFRTHVDDSSFTNAEVHTLLRTLTNEDLRKKIWQEHMRLGEQISPGLLQLVQLRNQVANQKGFSNYYEMKLFSQEIDPREIDRHISQLQTDLNETFQQAKEKVDFEIASLFRIAQPAIRPWHYTHPYIPMGASLESHVEWNLTSFSTRLSSWLSKNQIEIDHILKSADLVGRPGKSQANCCLNINRRNDIRLLCNVSPNLNGLRVILHEVGHAVYESKLSPELPFILRQPSHVFLSEAIALLFERLKDEQPWLEEMGLSAYGDSSTRNANRIGRLFQLYWTITIVKFEKELYRNPEGALNDIWWTQVEEVMGISRPENWDYPYWAGIAHLTTLPVYYYNYLLGEIASSQIRYMLASQFGSWYSDEALKHMKDTMFQRGASISWDRLLLNCTTCDLNSIFIVDELSAAKER